MNDAAPKVRGIGSREYKLILSAERFGDRRRGTGALQDVVCRLAEQFGAETERQEDEEERRTHYLDTAGFDLHRAGFLLRLRFEPKDGDFKVTLKHRTPDRYVAAAQDLSLAAGNGELKFEEDILPPFRSVFSQSNAVRFGSEPSIGDVQGLVGLFPGLERLHLPGKTKLAVVNDFKPTEVFVKLCKLKLGDRPKIKCGLSFWYHSTGDPWPLIAELAYDCEAENADDFPIAVAEGAGRLYRSLQCQPGWFNPAATTKTRFAYEARA